MQPQYRFIPAWAGNTKGGTVGSPTYTVHPRVGGEHLLGRGLRQNTAGSSPRGRGTPYRLHPQWRPQRFIPAWAGNTAAPLAGLVVVPVHPRVGGEHRVSLTPMRREIGSSPRGRGTLRHSPLSIVAKPVHPRVGGEHFSHRTFKLQDAGSSPRGRGTLFAPAGGPEQHRFIPAWAGNTFLPTPARRSPAGSSPRGRGTRATSANRCPD